MKSRLLISSLPATFLAMAIQPALAADIYTGDPNANVEPQYEPIQQGPLWDSLYGGVYGGLNWKSAGVMGSSHVEIHHQPDGGLYAGINRQLGDAIVAGVEVQGGYNFGSGTKNGVTVDQDWESSLRTRMGYAFEENLVYGLAGLNVTRVKASAGGSDDSKWLTGYSFGAGVERQFTDRVTGRLEYDYTDYSAKEFDLGGSLPDIGLTGHGIKVGVGVQF